MQRTRDWKDSLLRMAWSAWAELGVSGWERLHTQWPIDPEALLLLTGSLAKADPRLRDESLDWCHHHGSLLSKARLARLLRSWPDRESWPGYGTLLESATGRSWPGAGDAHATFRPTGRSADPLELKGRPGAMVLRLRSGLGVSARSEILRVFLSGFHLEHLSAAVLADLTGYGKRNVATALEGMTSAAIVAARRDRNVVRYALARRTELERVFGPVPQTQVNFAPLCCALWILAERLAPIRAAPAGVRSVEARAALERARSILDEASAHLRRASRLAPPEVQAGEDAWPPYEAWADSVFERIGRGELPA